MILGKSEYDVRSGANRPDTVYSPISLSSCCRRSMFFVCISFNSSRLSITFLRSSVCFSVISFLLSSSSARYSCSCIGRSSSIGYNAGPDAVICSTKPCCRASLASSSKSFCCSARASSTVFCLCSLYSSLSKACPRPWRILFSNESISSRKFFPRP